MKRVYIDGGQIVVVFPYNAKLIEYVKTIHPDREFRKTPQPHWFFPATPFHAELVVNALEDRGFQIYNSVRNLLTKVKPELDVEAVQGDHLREYQKEAVAFLNQANGRALIGDEQGLGKTVEALAWIKEHDDELERVAVVSPANVVWKWQDECVRWLDLPREKIGVLEGFNGDWPDTPIIICSYAVFAKRFREFMDWEPDLFIADEAHYLKNYKAKRTKAMKVANTVARYFIPMSGTPFLNRPMELFSVLEMLNGMEWSNAWKFGMRYAGGESGIVEDYEHPVGLGTFKGKTNAEELRRRLEPYMIRRLKSDVLDELPDLTRTILPLDIDNLDEYTEAMTAEYDNALVKVTTLWQVIGRGKAKAAVSWVKDFFNSAEPMSKLVIFCHHIDNVVYLKEALNDYRTETITGDVGGRARQDRIRSFQTPGGPHILIITTAGSEGIDLFGEGGVDASNLLFVEREWSPAREEQVEGRLHRLGQKNAVEAHYLVARGTIDVKMAEVIDMKRSFIRDVVTLYDPKTTVMEDLLREVNDD